MSFLPGLSDVLEVVGGPLIGGLMSNQGAQQANSASAAMVFCGSSEAKGLGGENE